MIMRAKRAKQKQLQSEITNARHINTACHTARCVCACVCVRVSEREMCSNQRRIKTQLPRRTRPQGRQQYNNKLEHAARKIRA